MPKFLSLRNFRLASTTGHSAVFEANVPKDIPDALVPEAMAAGCVPVDSDDIPFHEDKARALVEFQGDIRKSMIWLAVDVIIKGNEQKNFDGNAVPKHEVISDRLGFDVSRAETLIVYQQYMQATADGNSSFQLHPESANVMRVVEADTKAELVELAAEFGLDEKKSKGLTVKDLRKLLLTKFSGVAA